LDRAITATGILDRVLSWNPDSTIASISDNVNPLNSQSFTYDPAERLLSATGGYGTISYTYDANGNRLSRTDANGALSFGYQPGSNRLNQVGAWAYTSDTVGNLTGVNGAVVSYGVNNRMIRVADSNGAVAGDYLYNGLGRRASKAVGGKLTVFAYDLSGNLILEYDWTTQAITEHVYGPSGRLATIAPDASIYWHHNDHLGTPQAMTDSTGKVVWTMSQTPFGIATANEDPDGDGIKVTNNFRFPGQYFDAETGVNYNYFRTYVPAFGRYTQHDPIGLNGGPNPFGYVGGNPVNWIDPWGLYRCSPNTNCDFTQPMQNSLQCFESCLGQDFTITGGRSRRNTSNSSHSRGEACDIGRNTNPNLNRNNVERCTSQCFPRGYGQEEQNKPRVGGTHFHIQLNSIHGTSPGFAPGIRPYQP